MINSTLGRKKQGWRAPPSIVDNNFQPSLNRRFMVRVSIASKVGVRVRSSNIAVARCLSWTWLVVHDRAVVVDDANDAF